MIIVRPARSRPSARRCNQSRPSRRPSRSSQRYPAAAAAGAAATAAAAAAAAAATAPAAAAAAAAVPYYYFTMPRDQTCWRPGLVTNLTTKCPEASLHEHWTSDIPYCPSAQRPVLLDAGPCDINSFSLTMPRGQTRWKLKLVIYIIAKVLRGNTCRRLRLLNTLCENTQRPDSLEAGPC